MGFLNSLKGLFGGGDGDEATDPSADSEAGGEDATAPADRASDETGEAPAPDADEDRRDGTVTEDGTPPTEGAEMLVEQATENGYDLGYSPESIATLDDLVADLPDDGLQQAAVHFGAYLGEVFVRNYDGVWTLHDEVGWVVELPTTEESGGGTATLAVPLVVQHSFEGEASFAAAHDEMLETVDREGPDLSETPYPEDVSGPQLREPAADPAADEVVQYYKDAAVELVRMWTEYKLTYEPDSLDNLDDLLADAFGREEWPGEADDRDEAEDGEQTLIPDDVDMRVPPHLKIDAFVGYLGETIVRNYPAEWRQDGGQPVIVVEGPSATAEIDPVRLVAHVLAGNGTFAEVRDRVLADAGVEADA